MGTLVLCLMNKLNVCIEKITYLFVECLSLWFDMIRVLSGISHFRVPLKYLVYFIVDIMADDGIP